MLSEQHQIQDPFWRDVMNCLSQRHSIYSIIFQSSCMFGRGPPEKKIIKGWDLLGVSL